MNLFTTFVIRCTNFIGLDVCIICKDDAGWSSKTKKSQRKNCDAAFAVFGYRQRIIKCNISY